MRHQVTSHLYYIGLFAGLLAVFLISPFFGYGSFASQLLGAALIFTLLFCVLVIGQGKKLMLIAALLAAPLVINIFGTLFGQTVAVGLLTSSLSGIAFVLLIIIVMLRDIFLSTKVDGALIIGAISLYLLLGLMWGFIYLAIEQLYPGSFNYDFMQTLEIKDPMPALMYYSMVTLTTLGYGDITPLSPPARGMATMQAVAGQIYLTVLVARLVGMHIAQKK
ncbi:MAG: ion channel [Candidatus Porifericomitaceae bacterium WSBS_2022_MAG_OTU9]